MTRCFLTRSQAARALRYVGEEGFVVHAQAAERFSTSASRNIPCRYPSAD